MQPYIEEWNLKESFHEELNLGPQGTKEKKHLYVMTPLKENK